MYHIYWNKLRITDLGTLSTKTIKGKVDYPVSFAYVKSTEGCTVLNAYYEADYKAARAHGIRTGTYHSFLPCHQVQRKQPISSSVVSFIRAIYPQS